MGECEGKLPRHGACDYCYELYAIFNVLLYTEFKIYCTCLTLYFPSHGARVSHVAPGLAAGGVNTLSGFSVAPIVRDLRASTVHKMYNGALLCNVGGSVGGGVVVTPGRHTKWYPRYTRYTRRM